MRSLPRFACVLILGLTCAVISQSQDSTRKTGGTITGRVTAANKGVAAVTVTVSMSGDALSGIGLTLKTATDDEGRFRISNLPAGNYYVWPFVPTFVVAEATGVYPQGKSVVVEEGETAQDIDFTLARGAVISGKVTDSAGRPAIDERIRVLPTDANLRRLASAIYPSINDIRTDDRGIYRAYGLPAGKYKISIGDEYGAFTSTRGRRFYPRTFHPDVADEAKAEVVEVQEGGEATNIDIRVERSLSGFSASGRFIDADTGEPVANQNFGLTIIVGGRSGGFMSGTGVSSSSGAFRIDNLPPGRYAVNVSAGSGTGYYGDSAAFDIVDSDVSDLETKIHRGATISGNVMIEGVDDKSVWARLSRARLEVIMWGEGNSISTATYSNINTDGSFQIGPLQAGKATLRLQYSDRNLAPEFVLVSVEVNGVDKSGGIQVTAGNNISGVRVVVGYGTGTIRGTVRAEGGSLTSNGFFIALVRPGNPLNIANAPMDSRGRFVFDHVPAGNYEVVVTAYLPKRVTARQPVVASNGVVTEVTVTLNLSPGPTPGP